MDFVPDLLEVGNLPEFLVGSVGRVEIIDNCMVVVTLCPPRREGEGLPAAVRLVWTVPAWCAARVALAQIADELAKLGLPLPAEKRPALGLLGVH